MSDIHPAVLANMNSIKNAMEHNKEAWLALFADDAEVYDPVGPSPLDPAAKGHHGKKAIEKFWDGVISQANLTMKVEKRYPCGNSCAVAMVVTNQLTQDKQTVIEMLAVYEVNDAGKIKSLKVYWEWAKMEAQLKALGFM